MAKTTLNAALLELRGSVDSWCYKQTKHGTVISRRPDMSRVKWSPKQQAHRALVAAAGAHYRKLMADPKQAGLLRKAAGKKGLPVSTYVISDFLRRARKS
jgi:hypothetical protein